jgi:alkanesulfonate monooxygenase SsuD/methylene tetrahydromethanopterin reductase-like flavin-dependent oxidoreductase (luciferase family)
MTDTPAATSQETPDIKELRERAERASQLERENADLKRREVFRKAGVDPDAKQAKYLFEGYKGELDPDAIRAEALEIGVISDQPDPQTQQELDAQQRMAGVAGQAKPLDPASAQQQLEKAFAEGGTAGLLTALSQQGVPISIGD